MNVELLASYGKLKDETDDFVQRFYEQRLPPKYAEKEAILFSNPLENKIPEKTVNQDKTETNIEIIKNW
jgi:hypothetical protein